MELTRIHTGQTGFYAVPKGNEPLKIERGGDHLPINKSTVKRDIQAEKAQLKKATRGFEAIFIRQLMSTMRSSMTEGSMFGEGVAGDIYGDMFDTSIAEVMSENSTLGLSDMMYRNMVKQIDEKEKALETARDETGIPVKE